MSVIWVCVVLFQKRTANEMVISEWSSDVCSSDRRQKGAADPRDAEADIRVVRQAGEVGFDLHQYGADIGDVAGGYRLGGRLGARLRGRFEVVDIGSASCRESVCQYV